MKQREWIVFFRQLAQIARAGISLEEGIQLIIGNEKEKYVHRTMIVKKLGEGKNLVEVLREEQFLDSEMLEMISIGMDTGNLEEVFSELANFYERELQIQEEVKRAFYYPLILGSMLIVVMSILIIKVLPIFKEVFEGMGIGLTDFTKWLFEAGNVIGISLMVVLILGWFIVFAGNFCKGFKKTRKLWSYLTKNSKLIEIIDLIRLTNMLSMLIKNGEDLDSALNRGSKLIRQQGLKEKVDECKCEWMTSADFMRALNHSQLFLPFIRKSLVLSLKSGTLEEGLQAAADYYEEELEKILMKRLLIIEPVSVGVVSIMIGSVLLAVMFPLMNLMNTFS